jgi:hypothetical protein
MYDHLVNKEMSVTKNTLFQCISFLRIFFNVICKKENNFSQKDSSFKKGLIPRVHTLIEKEFLQNLMKS